jgi:hypothetical protein
MGGANSDQDKDVEVVLGWMIVASSALSIGPV